MSQQEVIQFFKQYNAAFDTLDGDAVAALWHVPSGIVDSRTVTWWPERALIVANMHALCNVYRKAGYQRAVHQIQDLIVLGRNDAFVNVAWTIEDGDETVLQSFCTGYNLRRCTQEPGQPIHVVLCTAYEEQISKL
jgi:hypothetical protein